MLQNIRDKLSGWVARVVLGTLAVVFVFWGVELRTSYSASNYAATVNGDKISLRDAQFAWQQQQTQLQQMLKGDIPEALKKSQQQAVMDRLIRLQLLQQQADKLGYNVSDAALDKALQEIDEFKVDGKFNVDRYTATIRSIGKSKSQFEADYRNQLTVQRLQGSVANTAFITPDEATRAQALLNEQRDIEYATISAKTFLPTVNVSDAEVQSYYNANKSSYLTSETVDLKYVELKLSDVASQVPVTEDALRVYYQQNKDKFGTAEQRHAHHILITTGDGVDDAAAKKQAEDVLAKIKAGGSFEALAKQYSKDPGSAVKGGDLGWAKRGIYLKPFEDALFDMHPGEVRGPIKSDFGYHIIRLDEIQGGTSTFEQVRAEVEKDYRDDQAHSMFYDQTQKLADEAFSKMNELDSVAKEFNTTVKSIPAFTRNGGGEFGKDSPVINAAFSEQVLEKGENSPLVTIGEDRALVVRISDHKMPEQKPLDQVHAEILALLKDQVANKAAEQKSADIVKQLKEGSLQWSDAIKQASATASAKQSVGRTGSNIPAPVINAAFALPEGDITASRPAFATTMLENGDYAIIDVSAFKSGTAVENAAQGLAAIEAQQSAKLGRSEFATYVQELQRIAKININPNAFE